MPNKTEGCICTSTTGLSIPPLCPQHANASRQELLRQLAEQGEKLKAAEVLASASLLGKSAAEHRVSALCTERDGLKGRLERAMDLVRYKRAELHDDELITNEEYSDLLQIPGAVARLESYDVMREKVNALEQRVSGAKVCSHIYTRVALTSTTTCPACTRGIVWPQPAEQTAAPVAEHRNDIGSGGIGA